MKDIQTTLEKIDTLQPWTQNPRRNEHAVQKIATSIERFGFTSPIIARKADRKIIAGHTRWKAAKKIGYKMVPVRWIDISEEEAAALNLADNKLGELAFWDEELLSEILNDINDALDFDLSDLGFSESELNIYLDIEDQILEEDEKIFEDDEEATFQSKPGEYYQLGKHVLYCGRFQDMEDQKADVLFWDPPWDEDLTPPIQNYKHKLVFTDSNNFGAAIENFGPKMAYVFTWDCMNTHFVSNTRPLKRSKHCIVYGSMEDYTSSGYLLPKKADQPKRTTKNKRGTYRYTANPDGTTLADIYCESISSLHTKGHHPHEKPLAWTTAILANICSGTVFDATAGSGTSLIAAEKSHMMWKGAEIEPVYCDVIRKRWTQYAKQNNLDIGDGIE